MFFQGGAKVNTYTYKKPIKTVIAKFSDWAYYAWKIITILMLCKCLQAYMFSYMKNYDNTCNVIPQY